MNVGESAYFKGENVRIVSIEGPLCWVEFKNGSKQKAVLASLEARKKTINIFVNGYGKP